jgi:hypothetical protein
MARRGPDSGRLRRDNMRPDVGATHGSNPSPVTLRLMKAPERDTLSPGRGLLSQRALRFRLDNPQGL